MAGKSERRGSGLAGLGRSLLSPAERTPDTESTVRLPAASMGSEPALEDLDSPPNDDLTLRGRVPKIERMPEGIEVVEKPVGHAVAQWIVMVRCQCGRRWFELEFTDTATCPRCGMFLVVELDGLPPPSK